MIDFAKLGQLQLNTAPFEWAAADALIAPADAGALAASYPRDHFKLIDGYDGEKGYKYRARSLVHMGARAPSHPKSLSPAWRRLAADLLSPQYRAAMGKLIGRDLGAALLEVNLTEYGPGAWQGPHLDLREKIVTHVLYFNQEWREGDGGCLRILRSKDAADAAHEIAPLIGRSAVLVRSDRSWHTVTPVAAASAQARRSLNVIFHQPGAVSSMWQAHEQAAAAGPLRTALAALRRRLAGRPGALSR
jgi:2OG-Fe(II) oxygenase superfamily